VPRRTPGTDNRVLRVCRLLNRRRVRYVIVGGVAANLHGSVRATKDVDLLVPRDLKNTERLTVAATVTFDAAYPRRVVRRIAGVRVPYLNLDDLVRSKQTGRAQDIADIERLKGE